MLRPFFMLLVLVFVSSQTTIAQGPTTILVAGPPSEGFKDVYYGVEAGLFAKYGLDVQPRITNGGAVVLAGLAGGSYDVAYTNLVPVLQAHLHGLPFQIIAPSTMFMSERSQNAMLVTTDSPIHTARDLDGKTIGTQSLQDLNSVAMRAWVDKNGGNSSTLHVLKVPSAAAVASLTAHRIDAMARFARAMHESALYNNSHLAETIPLVASFSAVPADVIAHTVRSIDGEYVTPQTIQPLIDFAAKYGMIPHSIPAEDIISPAALKSPR
jgi:ABC-type nitrate/sulfonate/bicarbonate transport system substrate-binding protein